MSRLIVCGIALIVALLLGIVATFAQQFPCYPLDALLETAAQKGDEVLTVPGWKGAALARLHRERASVRYELTHPVSTVILIRKRDTGEVLVLLQIGGTACAPLPFDASSWNEVVGGVWGRGA